MWFGYLTLIIAFSLSTVAAYYSVLGLVAIFSAAVVPVMIMGGVLEISKVIVAMWLHRNWHRASLTYKSYLLPSLISLMLLTSMGIFGYLSKAHSDQNLISGDVQSKIALYDEKIRIAKENINANRAALKQLDASVDQSLSRSTTEQGVERSVQIRRQQGPERIRLLREIEAEQKKITQLNEERTPIAAQVRRVEAEVGPIKYIAALFYGDNLETTLLESTVRWVIILIVIVFDPLAIVLILAGMKHLEWENATKVPITTTTSSSTTTTTTTTTQVPIVKQVYLEQPWIDQVPGIKFPYQVSKTDNSETNSLDNDPNLQIEKLVETDGILTKTQIERVVANSANSAVELDIDRHLDYRFIGTDYIVVNKKMMHKSVAFALYPWIQTENNRRTESNHSEHDVSFGDLFPKSSQQGHVHVHTGTLPSKLYKFDGKNWIEVDKTTLNSYTTNEEYIKYLIDKINNKEISVEDLSIAEKNLVSSNIKI